MLNEEGSLCVLWRTLSLPHFETAGLKLAWSQEVAVAFLGLRAPFSVLPKHQSVGRKG